MKTKLLLHELTQKEFLLQQYLEKYPSLLQFSKSINIPYEDLVEAFEIEKKFHEMILNEKLKSNRKALYQRLYSTVHPIYQRSKSNNQYCCEIKSRYALLFKKELRNKSILDVGCGQGAFLISCARLSKTLNTLKLCGLDVTIPNNDIIEQYPQIEFINSDITEFKVDQKFDVIYSNHVLEHMATDDLNTHLTSIKEALNIGGTLIINMPNRLFGPSDVSRIIDFSYTGKIQSMGSHLNELTYNELISILKKYEFINFRTVFPHTKLRYLFRFFRMSTTILCKLEKSKFFLNFLHSMKYHKTCIAKLEISIICNKK